jgi:uncharacterized protein (DUF736 family)|tara:strand:- start:1269 stop:1679 length:411 start_codon:yes stop_codon:yes gene_type:complete
MSQRDNTNSGILYKNTDDWKIIQQGKLNIDGEEQRIIGVSRKNKDGQPMVELYRAIGTLKKNEDKQSDKSPNAKGVVNRVMDKGALTISAWKETSEAGNPYTSLKVREFSSDSSYSDPNSERNVLHKEESEDEIDW